MNTQNSMVHKLTGFSGKNLEDCDLDEFLNHFSLPMRFHSQRVAVCSAIMTEYANVMLNWACASTEVDPSVIAHTGGLCHDIGKLMFPALAASEDDYMLHPVYGAQLLEKHKKNLFSDEDETQMVLEIVRYHHERPDGSGFPYGLKAKNIPLAAGICAVADSLDHRVFSLSGINDSSTLIYDDIKKKNGSHFYESAINCFEQAWPRLTEQYDKWRRSSE